MPPALLRQGRHALVKLRRLHPFLNHISLTTIALILLWLYTIHKGERATFASHINACDWQAWESWPQHAQPHRVVLIADPQLVDAHTYPGRPWPLSTLTEKYTDRYMARNYRLINANLDPDSIIFLGDMFDGGREWSVQRARPLTKTQTWAMEVRAPATSGLPADYGKIEVLDPGWSRSGRQTESSVQEKNEALEQAHLQKRTTLDSDELKRFVHGEDGRWKSYSSAYWEWEYDRFGKIFLAADQLYPNSYPHIQRTVDQPQNAANVDNGAKAKERLQYSMVGSKPRTVISSLPGNHDIGFGSGVQLSVRARYKWHFGELSRVDVLGNHTFVSVDALSLAAWSQFESNGRETETNDAATRTHIHASVQDFLDQLPHNVDVQTQRAIHGSAKAQPGALKWKQTVADPAEDNIALNKTKASSSGLSLPLVLLTHVPLFREPDTDCGSQREKGRALSITGGYQYQNVLTRTLSNTVVQKLTDAGHVAQIFSGDDHDYCDVTHQFDSTTTATIQSIREQTVKSFSWAMGVRRPGFMLLSMFNPIDDTDKPLLAEHRGMQTHLCLLPDQLGIFIMYAQLAAVTLIVLLARAIIISLRKTDDVDDDDYVEELPTIELSNLLPGSHNKMAGSRPTQRHRASSTSLKPFSNSSLNVQRSAIARARSVSPGISFGFGFQQKIGTYSGHSTPSDHAGYSNDASDDEEARMGDTDYVEDSQGKWRPRRKSNSKLRRVWDAFAFSLLLVAGVAGSYYIVLSDTG